MKNATPTILVVNDDGITAPGIKALLETMQQIGRVVVNKTGISGEYDISLKWSPDVDGPNPPADSGPSIFTAMQEQLGLRLVAAKGPVKFLVIDHIDRPSKN